MKNLKLIENWKLTTQSGRVIRNSKQSLAGFSLVEMLVVIFIFSILGVVTTQSLALSLRGSQKSESVGLVKENLEYTVSTMERLLRNARSINVTDCNTNSDRLDYVDEYGIAAYFECSNTEAAIASGSATTSTTMTSNQVEILCSGAGYSPFSCQEPADPNSPSTVTIELRGRDANLGSGVEGADVTVNTKVLLRTYKY
jgi:prepilin-type N-terminal cleavage/methylation domain-containing protein